MKETAEVVKVSSDTVLRDWKLARAWLLTELSQAYRLTACGSERFFFSRASFPSHFAL